MKKRLSILLIIALFGSLSSCSHYASKRSLDSISLMMSKEDVIQKMDGKGLARGSIINKYDQVIEVREYQIDHGKTRSQIGGEVAATLCTLGLCAPLLFSEGEIGTYWLYFCNGSLVQWGKAGDWAEAQRMIYDINFKISSENQ